MWLWSVSPSESLLQPTSSEYEPSWVDKPRVRGTFDILSSCILTLIICTYTTVHVDIPCYQDRIRKDSWWIKLYPRLSWMVLGLLTPELIVMSAWLQYMAARKVIMKLLRTSSAAVTLADSAFPLKVGSDPESQEPCTNRPGTWKRLKNWLLPPGLERGFYIVMGGFYIVVDYDGHGVNNQIRKTVTPEGVVLLQQLSLLPSINIEAIRDKSKVDSLSKVLMCLQISWMVVQSIARKANGLPLTLLEFNTVVHVGCALLMYILWLKKPQDVGFPMEVTDPRAVVLLLIKRIEDANRNKDVTIIDVKEHVLE